MNDSLRTDIFLRYTPETIACACIDLAARNLQIPLPQNPPWYFVFGTRADDVQYILIAILRLYHHRPKSLDELETIVDHLRSKRDAERRKSRFDVGHNSSLPTSTTQTALATSTMFDGLTSSSTLVAQLPQISTDTSQDSNAVTTTNDQISAKQKAVRSSRFNDHRRQSSARKKFKSRSRSSSPKKKKKTSYRSRSQYKTDSILDRYKDSSTSNHRQHYKEKHDSSNYRRNDRKHSSSTSKKTFDGK